MEIRVKEKRNKIFTLLLAVVAMMTLADCHHHHETEGNVFQQTVTLPSEKADTTVALDNLKSAIKDDGLEYDADWLTVIKQGYTSGSPSLRLIATDNVKDDESTNSRNCTVTVTAISGDKVLLSVTQEGEERKTGIDDSHDMPTDQPAYSRKH